MLKCTQCNKLSHEACSGFNAKMRKFMCATCQLLLMDPFYKPVMTLIDPFIVHKYSERREDTANPRFPEVAKKYFDFNANCMKALLSDKNIMSLNPKMHNCVIQLRCIPQNN